MKQLLAAIAATLALCAPAHATRLWNWSYSGSGISASGAFTTTDTPDASGFYRITGVTGQRNGVAITELTPAGAAIPGNEPYTVDDLVRVAGPQLTVDGLGFALADGSYSSPFCASSSDKPACKEFHSMPASRSSAEGAIHFNASLAATPAPDSEPSVKSGPR